MKYRIVKYSKEIQQVFVLIGDVEPLPENVISLGIQDCLTAKEVTERIEKYIQDFCVEKPPEQELPTQELLKLNIEPLPEIENPLE